MFELKLQLFANANTNVTTDSGLTHEMKTFYDMRLIDEASANLVFDQFGQKRPIPSGSGKTIEFRKFDALPTTEKTPLVEGVTPDGKKLRVTTVEATVEQYGDYITQSDVLELTSIDNTIVEATKILGRQAGMTLDSVVRNKLMEGTNVIFGGGGMDSSDVREIEIDDVKLSVATLKAQNAPTINGDFVGVIHPLASFHLMNDPKWEEYHKYTTSENLYSGEIGRIAGVRFVESTNAPVYVNSAGTLCFGTMIIGDGAYGVTEVTGGGLETIIKQKGSAGTADPLNQRSTIGWKAMKTAEILVEQYMVRIESKCGEKLGVTANV